MNISRHRTPSVSPQLILDVVVEDYRCTKRELVSQSRHRCRVEPRHVAMYLMRQHAGMVYEEIGMQFGGRDHSSVLMAIRSVERSKRASAAFAARLLRIEEAVQRRRQYTVVEQERDEMERAIENLVGLA